jgi:hypothetical protein
MSMGLPIYVFLLLLLKRSRLLGALFHSKKVAFNQVPKHHGFSTRPVAKIRPIPGVIFTKTFWGKKLEALNLANSLIWFKILRYGFIGSLSEPNSIKVGSPKE